MAKKVAVVNMKGGVGKTTLAVNLAYYFAERQERSVLIVDLDPQFNTTQYLMLPAEYDERIIKGGAPTIWHVFEAGEANPLGQVEVSPGSLIVNIPTEDDRGRLDLVPSQLELAGSLRAPLHKERKLVHFIEQIENKYDVIVFDCPPTHSILMDAAFLASDYVLIPVELDFFAKIGVILMGKALQEFRDIHRHRPIRVAGVLFNNTRGYSPVEMSRQDILKTAEERGWHVFTTEIPYSESFGRGAENHRPIYRVDYVTRDRVKAFEAFVKELEERIGL